MTKGSRSRGRIARAASTGSRRSTAGVRRYIDAGEEARFVPALPLKLVIIDEQIVMFGIEDPVAGRAALTMIVVEHPSLAKLLKIAFDAVWETGLTFDEASEQFGTRPAQTA